MTPRLAGVPAFVVGAVGILILTGLALVGRVVGVAALSGRHPEAAEFVARYWMWFPVLVVGLVVGVVLWPVGPLLVAAAIAVVVAKPELFGLPSR